MEIQCVVLPVIVASALLLDTLLGEPKRFHPLVGFGRFARTCERISEKLFGRSKFSGALAWLMAVGGAVAIMGLILFAIDSKFHLPLAIVILYLTIGGNSLKAHAMMIYQPLADGDLSEARAKVGWIVSRDTTQMDKQQIISATIESVLENGNDAVFGALFWFVIGYLVSGSIAVAGLLAVALRLINTLDAMWGYKNDKYLHFGFIAAKLDDMAGFLPARLTALTYALQGECNNALRCWHTQAKDCISPNGGVVMSAGAGALNCKIGGPAIYQGQLKDKIYMGCGQLATSAHILQAVKLVNYGSWLWLIALVGAALIRGFIL